MTRRFVILFVWLFAVSLFAQEVMPPKPDRYFNDYAHVVDSGTANQLNTKLENLEKTSSDQVVVAIFPKMQSDSSIDDYSLRVARSWDVGQKGKNNGVVLFVFVQDRKMFIQVGYGLEGVLPDAICKQITEYEIKPRFHNGDYAGGLTAGVNSIIAAVNHEYKGAGTTVYQRRHHGNGDQGTLIFVMFFVFILLIVVSSALSRSQRGRGRVYGGGGWGGWGGWGGGGWGGGWGGGSSGGGGFSGGGFSGGGGSFGGGGAGSSW